LATVGSRLAGMARQSSDADRRIFLHGIWKCLIALCYITASELVYSLLVVSDASQLVWLSLGYCYVVWLWAFRKSTDCYSNSKSLSPVKLSGSAKGALNFYLTASSELNTALAARGLAGEYISCFISVLR
jgi:hypothetical protein